MVQAVDDGERQIDAIARRHFQRQLRLEVERLDRFNRRGGVGQPARFREAVGQHAKRRDRIAQRKRYLRLPGLRVGANAGMPVQRFREVDTFPRSAVCPHGVRVYANGEHVIASPQPHLCDDVAGDEQVGIQCDLGFRDRLGQLLSQCRNRFGFRSPAFVGLEP